MMELEFLKTFEQRLFLAQLLFVAGFFFGLGWQAAAVLTWAIRRSSVNRRRRILLGR